MSFDEERNTFRKQCAIDTVEDAKRMLEIGITCLYDTRHRINVANEWAHNAGDTKNVIYTANLGNRICKFIEELEELDTDMTIS